LPLTQDQIPLNGHAFEVRLYAEDVPKGFLPATGTLTHLHFPPEARADSGVRQGDTISPFYDPMIAKLITHGASRAIARARMAQALECTQVAGSVTNHSFLRALVAQADFGAGDVDTGLIERHSEALTVDPIPCSRTRALAGIGALGLDRITPFQGFTLWQPMTHCSQILWGEEEIALRVATLGQGLFQVTLADKTHLIERRDDTWWIDGDKTPAQIVCRGSRDGAGHGAGDGAGVSVFWGNGYHFTVPDPLDKAETAAGDGSLIVAPMPGLVKSVFATAGQEVTAGDRLAILEAMKMEHVMTAARDGVVAEVLVSPGTQVEAGAALIRLEALT